MERNKKNARTYSRDVSGKSMTAFYQLIGPHEMKKT